MTKKMTVLFLLLASFVSVAFAGKHKVDDTHAFVWFTVNHIGMADTMGTFREITGHFDLEAGNMSFTLRADSVDTNNAKRDEHLKGPDFFNVKQFPVIQFKSKKVTSLGADRYRVTGQLSLHGKKKDITLEVKKTGEGKDPWGHQRMGLQTEFTLNRLDYGINYMPDGIGKEVSIKVSLEGLAE